MQKMQTGQEEKSEKCVKVIGLKRQPSTGSPAVLIPEDRILFRNYCVNALEQMISDQELKQADWIDRVKQADHIYRRLSICLDREQQTTILREFALQYLTRNMQTEFNAYINESYSLPMSSTYNSSISASSTQDNLATRKIGSDDAFAHHDMVLISEAIQIANTQLLSLCAHDVSEVELVEEALYDDSELMQVIEIAYKRRNAYGSNSNITHEVHTAYYRLLEICYKFNWVEDAITYGSRAIKLISTSSSNILEPTAMCSLFLGISHLQRVVADSSKTANDNDFKIALHHFSTSMRCSDKNIVSFANWYTGLANMFILLKAFKMCNPSDINSETLTVGIDTLQKLFTIKLTDYDIRTLRESLVCFTTSQRQDISDMHLYIAVLHCVMPNSKNSLVLARESFVQYCRLFPNRRNDINKMITSQRLELKEISEQEAVPQQNSAESKKSESKESKSKESASKETKTDKHVSTSTPPSSTLNNPAAASPPPAVTSVPTIKTDSKAAIKTDSKEDRKTISESKSFASATNLVAGITCRISWTLNYPASNTSDSNVQQLKELEKILRKQDLITWSEPL